MWRDIYGLDHLCRYPTGPQHPDLRHTCRCGAVKPFDGIGRTEHNWCHVHRKERS